MKLSTRGQQPAVVNREVTHGHFRSHDKDGDHAIQKGLVETPC